MTIPVVPVATIAEISFDDALLLVNNVRSKPVPAVTSNTYLTMVTKESQQPRQPTPAFESVPLIPARPAVVDKQASIVKAHVIDLDFSHWRKTLHEAVLYAIDLRRIDANKMSEKNLKANVKALIKELLTSTFTLSNNIDTESLTREVLDEAVGLGPLEPLIADDSVTEILVNRFDEI